MTRTFGNINMIQGDCMEFMRSLPDKAYELAIVDPPYGINGDKGVQKNNGKWGYKKHKSTNWDHAIPDENYFKEVFRISANQIIWGGNYFTEYLPPRMGWAMWDKAQIDFSFSDFELAWTSFQSKCRKFELIRGFDYPGVHYSAQINGRIHPTQKPTALYKWLLENYASSGDKILDTHGGSGSIAIACYDMGFALDWIERDKDYYAAAVSRLETHVAKYAPAHQEPITKQGQFKLF